ncbi:hypothetical protein [Streptomyces sp. URMC 129]|uniref:hypothetical protein n=1 Tax=Streptomyces sp. URMC 129 TaxID=3423407 RepID=UPI003F1A5075
MPRIARGRERPTTGTVLFADEPLDENGPATGAHHPDLTAREHLMLVALPHGLGPDAAQVVAGVLQDHHLAGHSGVLPSALSSGQFQALALSAAFVRPHDLLVLDEPEQRLGSRARRRRAERLPAAAGARPCCWPRTSTR